MILQKLTMANFRQFRGVQTIEFARPSDGNRNVTVVFGENGRGKTGVFRAIMFCLFGDRRLSQDGDVPDSELLLVNVSSLEQSEGKPVLAYVELEFTHQRRLYTLTRVLSGARVVGRTVEEFTEMRLVETTPDGNSKIIDPNDIGKIVNSILDRRVKDYFLFDGEKIERLTRADVEQRREISKGIKNLLNVNALETAKKATGRLTKELESQLGKEASPELAKLLNRLAGNEQAQKDKKDRLDVVGSELALARTEIRQVDKELEAYKEIREQVEKRQAVEKTLEDLEQRRKDHLSRMKDLVVKASLLVVAPSVTRVFQDIERQKQQGQIPSEIRKDLIERILSEKRCICGNDVCEGTDAYIHIIEWKNRTSDGATQDAALNLWRYLSQIRGSLEEDFRRIEDRLLEFGNIRNDIESARGTLEDLRQSIGSPERQDVPKLDAHRKNLEMKVAKLEVEAENLEDTISDLEKEHGQLNAQLREVKAKQGKLDELSRRASLARDTLDALETIYDDFTKEIKLLISKRATEIFSDLLDSEGRQNLRAVMVNDDYSLQVLDRWNRPFLANISAGQRQVMSISFIAALAEAAASKDAHVEMPLFMDTPFGRLSFEHRQNIIRMIPDLASQWVLLATDTEFRKQEARLLGLGLRWGRFYALTTTDDGNTSIEEHPVDSVQALLKDGTESI